MESTDGTLEIARRHGCKIVTFPKKGTTICEPARNTAIQSASNPWVLVVDADEIITRELRDYLYSRVERGDCPEGLFVPRVNRFMDKYNYSAPEQILRFMRRDKCNWPPTIHSRAEIDGNVEKIPTNIPGVHMLHLADSTLHSVIGKMNNYTDEELKRRSHKKWGVGAFIYRPMLAFFRTYILQKSYREGKRGLIRAYMNSQYQHILVAKLIEQRYKAQESKPSK